MNKLKKSLTKRNECVRQNLETARDRQKKSYDKFVRDNLVFEEGDLSDVLI